MSKRGLELLAPAGDLPTLKTVIDAGADAVYFGGELFGARAYARNFSREDSLEGIAYAHLFGRKTYLTVNTLIKNSEFSEKLYSYLKFYSDAGIDGFLVQDIGLLSFIKKYLPEVPVHISTQMSVSSSFGVSYLKDLGADRVVLSRELSLKEIKKIHDETGMELETFVHGAICVSYSGNCLMSSILGGRSGNRGRCAQPCRLSYSAEIKNQEYKEKYLLSPKDMCLLQRIPELYEAGVYSLKIEGRMKSPQYAGGVVRIYKKYIDSFLKNKTLKVSPSDMALLKSLGNRGFTDLYLDKNNGPELMSMEDSSLHTGDIKAPEIKKDRIKINIKAVFKKGEAAKIRLSCRNIEIEESEDIVEIAKNRPLSFENIEKHLKKTGYDAFFIDRVEIDMDDDIFIPVSKINELRRKALKRLISVLTKNDRVSSTIQLSSEAYKLFDYKNSESSDEQGLMIMVSTVDQLKTVLKEADRPFILILSHSFMKDFSLIQNIKDESLVESIGLYLPPLLREKAASFLLENKFEERKEFFDYFVASSFDSLGFLKDHNIAKSKIIAGHRLYSFNNEAVAFLRERAEFLIAPFELNRKELSHRDNRNGIIMTYGRIPLMIMANCTKKNLSGCDKKPEVYYLKDRKGKTFPVRSDCNICMNTIYNSLPLDLYSYKNEIRNQGFSYEMLSFTTESGRETEEVLKEFLYGTALQSPTTRGHFNRGVL